ncbi:MAG: Holliday junction resolvase RuvX [Verrucomicrobiota bacterium]
MSSFTIKRRILGVDFGRARIGVAVSDELGLMAHPVETVPTAGGDALKRVAEIAREKNVERVVIGLPRHMNGSVGEAAGEALAFAEKLRPLLTCDVLTWDERLTTIAANRALQDLGKKTRASRSYVDQVAAQIILQSYLDSLPSESP